MLVLVGIASVQLGASIAKSLFDDVSPTTIVWLRLATSAMVLVAIARPRLQLRSRADLLAVAATSVTDAVANAPADRIVLSRGRLVARTEVRRIVAAPAAAAVPA